MGHITVRPLTARDPHEPGRVATPLELFFDLVAVAAIAALVEAFHHQVSHGHGLEYLLPFSVGVIGIWWVWCNFTWFASSFDNHDTLYRLMVFTMMGGFAVFAGGIGYVFENEPSVVGVIGWIIMRAALVLLWIRAAIDNPQFRHAALIYAVGLTLLQTGWFLAYVTFELQLLSYWWVGLALMICEFSVPLIGVRVGHPPLHLHHMVERHGLFNIIVLGEIVLSATLFFGHLYEAGHWDWPLFWGGTLTVAVAAMMWLYYFIEEDHLRILNTPGHFRGWAYLHVIVYGAAALFGAAAAAQMDMLTHHSEASPHVLALFTNGAIAGYILGIWLIRDRHLPDPLARWAPLAGVALLAGAFALALPYWATALIFLAALILRMLARHPNHQGAH